jgi:hypothetical protein
MSHLLRSQKLRHIGLPLNPVLGGSEMSAPRSDEEMRRAAEHLEYEFWMLTAVAEAMASGISSQGWLTNALLESFVIHFRALVDFFYPPPNPKSDDIQAAHYFDDPTEWELMRPPLSDELKRGRARAHKEIAHLTYARLEVTRDTKPWPFVEIANQMQALMGDFRKGSRKIG